jgi:hypothetical protein
MAHLDRRHARPIASGPGSESICSASPQSSGPLRSTRPGRENPLELVGPHHLEPIARQIGARLGLRNHPVQAGAFETRETGVSFASFSVRDAAGCSRCCSAANSSPCAVAITFSPSSTQFLGSRLSNASCSWEMAIKRARVPAREHRLHRRLHLKGSMRVSVAPFAGLLGRRHIGQRSGQRQQDAAARSGFDYHRPAEATNSVTHGFKHQIRDVCRTRW